MVEAWTEYQDAKLFVLRDDNGEVWHWVKIIAQTTYTDFLFKFEDSLEFSYQSEPTSVDPGLPGSGFPRTRSLP